MNYLLQSLMISSNSPIIRYQDQKWTFNVLCPYLCCYVTIHYAVLEGETLISMAKIVFFPERRNKKAKIMLGCSKICQNIHVLFGSLPACSYLCSVRTLVLTIRAESREGKTISTLPIKKIEGASNEVPLIFIEDIFS